MIRDLFDKLGNHPKRLLHCFNVGLIAKSLAAIYNENTNDAYLAGLLHDYAKYEDDRFFKEFIPTNDYLKYKNDSVIYHGISAANYFLNKYYISNDIYGAIYNHVFGRPYMTIIEKIIFISDSICLNGNKDSRYIYDMACKDLEQAVILALEMTFKDLEDKGLHPNKFQLETYNYYLGKETI